MNATRAGSPGPGRSRRFLSSLSCLIGTAAIVLVLAGCATPRDESLDSSAAPALSETNRDNARGSLASVKVVGHSRLTVSETVQSVFTGAGLTLAGKSDDLLTFERPATRGERAAYGSWQGDKSKVRLKVQIIQEGSKEFFLCCRSYIARSAGAVDEDEQSLARRKVRQYEGLLREVATRLN